MASIRRSAVLAAARSVTIRTKTVVPNPPPSRRAVTTVNFACRPLASISGGMESLRPLHSAIASARLISNIAVDTSYWSCVSQGALWWESGFFVSQLAEHQKIFLFTVSSMFYTRSYCNYRFLHWVAILVTYKSAEFLPAQSVERPATPQPNVCSASAVFRSMGNARQQTSPKCCHKCSSITFFFIGRELLMTMIMPLLLVLFQRINTRLGKVLTFVKTSCQP